MNFTPLCIFITERDEVKNKVTKMFPLSGYGKRCSWSSKQTCTREKYVYQYECKHVFR